MLPEIIHIMDHPPAYEEYSNTQKPKWNWNTKSGTWVGIWGYDWVDCLSIESRKVSLKFKHEIWQPDLRADQMYSQEIFPGVVHRLFPSKTTGKYIGLRKSFEVDSPAMIEFLSKRNISGAIIHISQSVTSKINRNLLSLFPDACFAFSYHGQISLPIVNLLSVKRNLPAKIHYFKDHFLAKKLFKKISFLTYQNKKNLQLLKLYYSGPLENLTMGIHFDKYQGFLKNQCRSDLNLPLNKIILLTVCRLYDLKQVDKTIELLSTIEKDFLFIIVGHGNRKYEEYLRSKAKKLINQNKIIFTGYKTGNDLIKYFKSADLFIHVSKAEGGPVVNMEAMACGLPVFCTDTGNTAEVLNENNAGILVSTHKNKEWKEKLVDFLNGKTVIALNPGVVKKHYDWQNVAGKFITIYDHLIDQYSGNNFK